MRVALDTTILACAEGIGGPSKHAAAVSLLEQLPPDAALVPVQALGELYQLLLRAGRSPQRSRDALLDWRDHFGLIETTPTIMLAAADISTIHGLRFWDGLIVAAAAAADCRLILSLGITEGFTWQGVRVTDPFTAKRVTALERLLAARI